MPVKKKKKRVFGSNMCWLHPTTYGTYLPMYPVALPTAPDIRQAGILLFFST